MYHLWTFHRSVLCPKHQVSVSAGQQDVTHMYIHSQAYQRSAFPAHTLSHLPNGAHGHLCSHTHTPWACQALGSRRDTDLFAVFLSVQHSLLIPVSSCVLCEGLLNRLPRKESQVTGFERHPAVTLTNILRGDNTRCLL